MAPKDGERSAASATRFTATTPHASSKRSPPAPVAPRSRAAPVAQSARQKPTSAATAATATAAATASPPPPPKSTNPPGSFPRGNRGETPEQRVNRLRAAHQAAKNARTSPFDRFLDRTRPILNSAHKITVMGLVGLTVVAGVMTGYTALDMMRHNRKRQAEFLEAQQKMAADSLEAARLAYMRGEANDEQIALVEDANARASGQGLKLPSILSAPTPLRKDIAVDGNAAGEGSTTASTTPDEGTTSSRLVGWLAGIAGGKKEGHNATAEVEAKEIKPERTLEEKRAMLEQARAAFETEKENQQVGGPLDRLGNAGATPANTTSTEQPKKKGWLW